MAKFKVGDRVFVPPEYNCMWTGIGEVVRVWDNGDVRLKMLTGKFAGDSSSSFPWEKLKFAPQAYLCLTDDDCYIAHEGSLETIPSFVVKVWSPGVELEKTVTWREVQ